MVNAPQRGQLFRLKPDTQGKSRPIAVVSNNALNGGHSVVAVPFYSRQMAKRTAQPWCCSFSSGEGGLPQDCVAKTDEISLIDKLEIDLQTGPIGSFDAAQMARLEHALKWSLVIP
jgi:mRNA-degrading endonuclease toxin of MazEF toxin-antitoxin module